MEMVNATVAKEQLDKLVNTLMDSHGFGNKHSLTLKDFQSLMQDYSGELSQASLYMPGNKRCQLKTDKRIAFLLDKECLVTSYFKCTLQLMTIHSLNLVLMVLNRFM